MTLVVAKQDGNLIRFIADTQLTLETWRARQRPEDAVLKVVFVGPLAVAFAGNKFLADRALEEWKNSDVGAVDKATEFFLEHQRASDDAVEFLIASATHPPSLVKVSGGEVSSQTLAYLGNAQAFASYREQVDGGAPEFVAMAAVGASSKFPDIGGFPLEAVLTPRGGHFPSMFGAHFGLQPFTTESTEYVPVPAPTAAKGQLSYSRSPVTRDGQEIGVAIYIPQACFGAVFAFDGTGFPEAEIFAQTRPLAFREKAFEELGVEVHSGQSETPEKVERVIELMRSGETERAYRQVNLIQPFPGELRLVSAIRADVCLWTGRREEALRVVENALSQAPNDHELLLRQTQLMMFLNDELAAAKETIMDVLDSEPRSTVALQLLVNVSVLLGDLEAAQSAMERLRDCHILTNGEE